MENLHFEERQPQFPKLASLLHALRINGNVNTNASSSENFIQKFDDFDEVKHEVNLLRNLEKTIQGK